MPYDVSGEKGGCACGAIRYELADAATIMSVFCFCRNCQISGGTEGAPVFSVPKDSAKVIGNAKARHYISDRGTQMHSYFCGECGGRVYGICDEMPELIIFRAGSLDNPGVFKPEAYIFTAHTPKWVVLNKNIPSFPGMPALPNDN